MSPDKERIRCSVSNCHYWMTGNYCEASSIVITGDQVGAQSFHGMDASMISQVDTPVGRCEATCCKTFISKQEKDEHQVDNVYKIGNQLTQGSQSQPRSR